MINLTNLDLLTNDAKFLLAKMYGNYIKQRKNKVSKEEAISFKSIYEIHENFMSEWSLEDTTFTAKELLDAGFIKATYIENYVFVHIKLTTVAISIMENRFKDKLDSVLDYALKIKELITFN